MNWKLIEATDTKWIRDDSGYYTLINYVKDNIVRLDFMGKDDMPVMSFQGTAENVRKHAVRYADKRNNAIGSLLPYWNISLEHASYIGRKLARAELLKTEYIQD